MNAPHLAAAGQRVISLEAAALAYLNILNWSVLPIRNDRAGHKRPACASWKPFQKRRVTPDEIRTMFSKPYLTGVAGLMGEVSCGLYGRDFDQKDAYLRWAAHYPHLAKILPTVQTPRGAHSYAYVPDGEVKTHHFPDGELKGEGGYMLLPPSVHPSGARYTWLISPRPRCAELTLAPDVAGFSRSWTEEIDPSPVHRDTGTQVLRDSGYSGTHVVEKPPGPEAGDAPFSLTDLLRLAQPANQHENHGRLFFLARGIRALELQEGRTWTLHALRREIFAPWYAGNSHLRPEQSRDAYLLEFLAAYEDVQHPLGDGVLDRTWALAIATVPPEAAMQFEDPKIRLLVAWCAQLQRAVGGGAFFLSTRTVAVRLQLASHSTAAMWLHALVKLGILVEVSKGGIEGRSATTFRYVGG